MTLWQDVLIRLIAALTPAARAPVLIPMPIRPRRHGQMTNKA
jgi:hypothetical protein